jgi:predicted transcriptional regulator
MSGLVPSVDDYMTRDLITFRPSDDIHKAIRVLLDRRISGAPVVDDDERLVGVVSKKDCLKVVYSAGYHQDWGGQVEQYMSPDVITLESGTDIISAADRFMQSSFRRFPIVINDRIIGLICRHDILRALEDLWSDTRVT